MSFVWATVVIVACLVACGAGEEAPRKPDGGEEPASELSKASGELSPVAVLMIQRVKDYESWKREFDDQIGAREKASCSGHSLKRGFADPNMIVVFCPATDAARLQDFLESEGLARSMSRAGVEGAPSFIVMKPASRNLVSGENLHGIIMTYSVSDYEAWRLAYDGLEQSRAYSGIVGQAVGRKLDDPDSVVVYHQARNIADLRAFADSSELRELLERVGALADFKMNLISVLGSESYR